MKVKGLLLSSLALAAAMVVFAFYVAGLLPEGEQLAIHWNVVGQADRFAEALPALLLPAALVAGLAAVFAIVPQIEPLQEKLAGSAQFHRVGWIAVILMMALGQLVIAAPVLGLPIGAGAMLAGAGVMLMVIGNALPKTRPGFFMGIRTPWAIMDTDNWIATHRLGGKLMIVAGALMVVMPILPISAVQRAPIGLTAILGASIIPVIYSWWLWHSKKKQAQ